MRKQSTSVQKRVIENKENLDTKELISGLNNRHNFLKNQMKRIKDIMEQEGHQSVLNEIRKGGDGAQLRELSLNNFVISNTQKPSVENQNNKAMQENTKISKNNQISKDEQLEAVDNTDEILNHIENFNIQLQQGSAQYSEPSRAQNERQNSMSGGSTTANSKQYNRLTSNATSNSNYTNNTNFDSVHHGYAKTSLINDKNHRKISQNSENNLDDYNEVEYEPEIQEAIYKNTIDSDINTKQVEWNLEKLYNATQNIQFSHQKSVNDSQITAPTTHTQQQQVNQNINSNKKAVGGSSSYFQAQRSTSVKQKSNPNNNHENEFSATSTKFNFDTPNNNRNQKIDINSLSKISQYLNKSLSDLRGISQLNGQGNANEFYSTLNPVTKTGVNLKSYHSYLNQDHPNQDVDYESISAWVQNINNGNTEYNPLQLSSNHINIQNSQNSYVQSLTRQIEQYQQKELENTEIVQKLREIVHNLQLRDASQRLEISKLKKGHTELIEQNEKSSNSIQNLEKKIQQDNDYIIRLDNQMTSLKSKLTLLQTQQKIVKESNQSKGSAVTQLQGVGTFSSQSQVENLKYIQQLQKRIKFLENENEQLKNSQKDPSMINDEQQFEQYEENEFEGQNGFEEQNEEYVDDENEQIYEEDDVPHVEIKDEKLMNLLKFNENRELPLPPPSQIQAFQKQYVEQDFDEDYDGMDVEQQIEIKNIPMRNQEDTCNYADPASTQKHSFPELEEALKQNLVAPNNQNIKLDMNELIKAHQSQSTHQTENIKVNANIFSQRKNDASIQSMTLENHKLNLIPQQQQNSTTLSTYDKGTKVSEGNLKIEQVHSKANSIYNSFNNTLNLSAGGESGYLTGANPFNDTVKNVSIDLRKEINNMHPDERSGVGSSVNTSAIRSHEKSASDSSDSRRGLQQENNQLLISQQIEQTVSSQQRIEAQNYNQYRKIPVLQRDVSHKENNVFISSQKGKEEITGPGTSPLEFKSDENSNPNNNSLIFQKTQLNDQNFTLLDQNLLYNGRVQAPDHQNEQLAMLVKENQDLNMSLKGQIENTAEQLSILQKNIQNYSGHNSNNNSNHNISQSQSPQLVDHRSVQRFVNNYQTNRNSRDIQFPNFQDDPDCDEFQNFEYTPNSNNCDAVSQPTQVQRELIAAQRYNQICSSQFDEEVDYRMTTDQYISEAMNSHSHENYHETDNHHNYEGDTQNEPQQTIQDILDDESQNTPQQYLTEEHARQILSDLNRKLNNHFKQEEQKIKISKF